MTESWVLTRGTRSKLPVLRHSTERASLHSSPGAILLQSRQVGRIPTERTSLVRLLRGRSKTIGRVKYPIALKSFASLGTKPELSLLPRVTNLVSFQLGLAKDLQERPTKYEKEYSK